MFIFRLLRVLVRAPVALAWTLASYHFGIRLPQILGFKRRNLKVIGFWGRGLAWIMGVRIRKRNERTGPMGDVIVSNHMGFLDVPVLLRFFPAVFVIKMEMRRVYYFGKALERQGHVFVERGDLRSRQEARGGLMQVLKDCDRIIVFPEGRASPGSKRLPFKPFSFAAAKRMGKTVQACAVDYLPDRRMLEWDVKRSMLPQIVDLLGRRRIDISVEFFPAEEVGDQDPREMAERYHDLIQGRLEEHDRDRGEGAAGEETVTE